MTNLTSRVLIEGEYTSYSPRVDANQFLTVAKQCYGLDPPDWPSLPPCSRPVRERRQYSARLYFVSNSSGSEKPVWDWSMVVYHNRNRAETNARSAHWAAT